MHEQSETIQREDGKWVNVYGKGLPKAGQQLPNSDVYDSVDAAVGAAQARSKSFDRHDALPNPVGPVISTDRAAQAMAELERRAQEGALTPQASAALDELKRRRGISTDGVAPTPARESPQSEGLVRLPGVAATGFNKGLGGWVDLINDGLKGLGLPMSDEPFMGTAFVDKYLAGSQFQPQNMFESVLQRAGLEVGANVPVLGATMTAQAGAMAKRAAGSMVPQSASTNLEALKNLPKAFAEELTKISPAKLASLESALAAGAGTGAGIAREIFPEHGATAEFVGELFGAFTPSVALGLVSKAKELAQSAGRVALGIESEDETKRRLGQKLKDAATPEQVGAGVRRADELRQVVTPGAEKGEGLELSTGSAIQKGEVSATERAESKASIKMGAKLKDQRERNIQATWDYFNATAPEGDPIKLVETLQQQRAKSEHLLKMGLDRTEMRLAAARGELSKRQAAIMNDLEARMQSADNVLDTRLRAIGPQLRPQQRQDVIRQAYDEEIGKFRERSKSDYAELDMLGHAELPVERTVSKLAMLQELYPGQIQAIRKINPRVSNTIDNLGHDYELLQRAEKAQADLQAVGGTSVDQRGAFRLSLEQQGSGGTAETVGIKSNYPDWYRSIANAKIAGTDNTLDRQTIERAIDTIKTGARHGLHDKTIEHVKQALLNDREFTKTPFFESVMDELRHAPSASLKDLRQVRSDLLALGRKARASGDRTQSYVLHELVSGLDQDIDNLVPGTSRYAELYPDHGALYRQVSADYREGVSTLLKGQVGKLYQVKTDGSYSVDEGSVPALFWKDETSLDGFLKAFGSHADAKLALRDYALDDLYRAAVKPVGGGKFAIDDKALERWVSNNAPKLKAFPDLEPAFRNTVKLQEQFDTLDQQVKAFRDSKQGEERLNRRLMAERRPGDFSPQQIGEAEARLAKTEAIVDRTKTEWELSKASLFLKQPVNEAANAVVIAKDPLAAYKDVVGKVRGDAEAVAGLNRAVWNSISASMEPTLKSVSGSMNLGVWHKTMEKMVTKHGDLMKEVLGPDGFKRIQTAAEVVEKISTGAKAGSDTAINLQVHAALASTWLSRAWAVSTGRVPAGFGFAERAMQGIIKLLEKHTAQQQEGILLEAFTNPKMFQTLVNAAQYGANNRLVQTQMAQHLHLMNMSEQMPKENQ